MQSQERANGSTFRSIAETLLDEGREEGERAGRLSEKRETLLRLLRVKYKRIPVAIETTVQRAEDSRKLDSWLEAVITANKLSDIPFNGQK